VVSWTFSWTDRNKCCSRISLLTGITNSINLIIYLKCFRYLKKKTEHTRHHRDCARMGHFTWLYIVIAFVFVTAWRCDARVVHRCLIDELGADRVIGPWSGVYDSVRRKEGRVVYMHVSVGIQSIVSSSSRPV
jgi:hypothetical protein